MGGVARCAFSWAMSPADRATASSSSSSPTRRCPRPRARTLDAVRTHRQLDPRDDEVREHRVVGDPITQAVMSGGEVEADPTVELPIGHRQCRDRLGECATDGRRGRPPSVLFVVVSPVDTETSVPVSTMRAATSAANIHRPSRS